MKKQQPAAPEPSQIGGLLFGVQSWTYRKFTMERMIDSMRAVGLASVELWDGHLDPMGQSDDAFRRTRAMFENGGITINAYCANFRPDASDELLDRAFRGATLLGTSVLTTSTEKSLVPKLDTWAQRHEVTVGLHNHWLGEAWFQGEKQANFEGPNDFAEALAGRSNHIAINLDVGHFHAAGHDPLSFFAQHHARIVSLHLKDRDADRDRTHCRFGQGATPLAELLWLAHRVRYPRAMNIEYEIEEHDPTEGVRTAVEFVRHTLA